MKFLDQAKIYVKAGNGGSGSSSFRREKFVEFGGPDGGDGGTGGSVIFQSERNLNTLIDFRYKQHFNAEHGKSGSKKNKTGGGGKDLILQVPTGTQIFEEDNNTLILVSANKNFFENLKFDISLKKISKIKEKGKISFIISSYVKNCGFKNTSSTFNCRIYKPLISTNLIN